MRYDQVFWVGFNNPRFPYARFGYLPTLEPKEITRESDKVEPKVIHYHFRLPNKPNTNRYNTYIV